MVEQWLQWRRGTTGQPFRFIEFKKGVGKAVSGEAPDADDVRVESNLRSADLIAVNTLGQFSEHPRVAALREFITDWYVSYLSIDQTRNQPEAGLNERLSKNGENLPNVIQYLKEQHPDRLEKYLRTCAAGFQGWNWWMPIPCRTAACCFRSKMRPLRNPYCPYLHPTAP